MKVIEPIYKDVEYVVLVALALLVVLYIWRHLRNDRLARAAHVQAVEGQPSVSSVQQTYPAGNQLQQSWQQPSQSGSNGQQIPQQSWQQQQSSPSQPPRRQ